MPKSYESWESYFYPETYDPDTRQGTLRNLFGERDRELLKQFEKVETASRLYELETNQVAIERTFDSAHLRSLHGYIFQHVYEWAGLRELLRQMHHSSVPRERFEVRIDEMTPA